MCIWAIWQRTVHESKFTFRPNFWTLNFKFCPSCSDHRTPPDGNSLISQFLTAAISFVGEFEVVGYFVVSKCAIGLTIPILHQICRLFLCKTVKHKLYEVVEVQVI